MFRIFACAWLVLAIPFFGLGEEPEDETYVVLRSPAQYFAAGYHDSYYWTVLFPDNPSFSYACIYLPSFNREFGFYLEGNDLIWARAVGPSSVQMLSQTPIVDLQSQGADRCAVLLMCLQFPILGNMLEGWDGMTGGREEDIFSTSSERKGLLSKLPQYGEWRMFAARWMESMINPFLYRHLYVKRGKITLNPALADALRKTWDEAVERKTFAMDMYRQLLTRLDGDYFYFRGASGPVGEDLCEGEGMLRPAMRELTFGIVDMAMMEDWNAETEQWLMNQCAKIRCHASDLGEAPPPMVSESWVKDFYRRLDDQMEKERAEEKIRKEKEASLKEQAKEEKEKEPEADSPAHRTKEEYVRGFRERFLKPLDRNPLWRDLFPNGTQGKPGACWVGSRGISGLYLDGTLMGRAETLINTPLDIYDEWFYNQVPERALFPYDGIREPAGYGEPRVRREWISLGRDLSRLLEETLTDIAKGKMAGGKGNNNEVEETNGMYFAPFCIVRGADGTERIMSSADADLKTVVELMELWYTADLLFIDEDYLQGIFETRAVLQGKTARDRAAECPRASGIWNSWNNRFLWN
ncbi:hypothetical protein [Akkermansia sp.]|uniref:hypothetical protein n=2 Tax=Akkermansia sp. TaxID=1872421 RepID=UPI002673AA19|nr:hypothetical protein [Akkermansia sp.]MEE0765040.1 hypothetical protein [Akkermansia sp.]